MLRQIRKSKYVRGFAFFMVLNLLAEIISPNVALALTSGPSQPEVQGFEPIGTSDMVDLFSGDFKYNIPLMDVGGYPLNVAYNSGVGMDQEASWTGLGWNLNVGCINRSMRGLPDDFNGDVIAKEFNVKDNVTYGGHVKAGFEIFGWKKSGSSGKLNLSVGIGVTYNNYTGIGIEQNANFALSAGNGGKGKLNAGLGIKSSASEGLSITPSVSYSYKIDEKNDGNDVTSVSGGLGFTANSRAGLKDVSINGDISKENSYNQGQQDRGTSGSFGTGSSISFGAASYAPQINLPMVNNSVALSFKAGVHVYGSDVTLDVGGFYSVQKLAAKDKSLPAYGYMNAHNGQDMENALMDFNREKDGAIAEGMNTLPLPNMTYDIYNVAGQGIGGTFRPFRSDVGYVYDNTGNTTNDSYSISGEVSVTQLAHAGVNLSVVDVNTRAGKWSDDNQMKNTLRYRGLSTSDPAFEPFYFKEVGEKSVDEDPGLFESIGGFKAARVKVNANGPSHNATNQLEVQDYSGSLSTKNITQSQRSKRAKRNQAISYLNLAQAKDFGLQKSLYAGAGALISSDAKNHHIAEITTLRPDGMRYVYGLPAYNDTQEEVAFNIDGVGQSSADAKYGQIGYNAGADNSKSNSRGADNYYNKTTMPAYAHSYMLTAVVSADYVDLTGDGPSDDDLGSYTAFTYTALPNYEWRTPVSMSSGGIRANFNGATNAAAPGDNQANYVYGRKDLYYVKQIVTKNYIAIFETENREDGLQVNRDGLPQAGVKPMQRLKNITLYAKPDYNKQVASGGSYKAVPIKKAHFVYDYSLCKGIPNSSQANSPLEDHGGKLTLKQVYFTYGTSNKATFNKYEFTYGEVANVGGTNVNTNFSYDPRAYDRWGNYKPNQVNTAADADPLSTKFPNDEFPYVNQRAGVNDAALNDLYAAAWSLKTISLPSGATIDVTYESDDYAYVQNKPAMTMFQVVGVNNEATLPSDLSSNPGVRMLMKPQLSLGEKNNLYMFFKLPATNYAGSTDEFKRNYLRDLLAGNKYMYFKFLVNLTMQGSAVDKNLGDYFEYVTGYAQIEPGQFGTINSGGSTYGYVKLKTVDVNDKPISGDVNPICKAAWQMGRVQFPQLVWDATTAPGGGVKDVVKALVNSNIAKNLIQGLNIVGGPNAQLRDKDYGKEFITHKSTIRLYEPSRKKMGGGCRVKKLTISDNWSDMTSGQATSDYGQEYTYTTEENGVEISSGVAAYEPMIGNDENPWRQPNFYGKKAGFLVPSNRFFNEEPFGETFFPSPTVGYSEVTVRNLRRDHVTAHATGHIVNKFYTAKDYPTIVERTQYENKHFKPPFASLFKVLGRDFYMASQGYCIELNDMHGKEKGQEVYAEGKSEPISKVEHLYKTEGNGYIEPIAEAPFVNANLRANRLSNTFVTINKKGEIGKQNIGIEYDAVTDFRESKTTTVIGGAQVNLSAFLAGIFPFAVPTIWPDFGYEETRMRSAVMTKVIQRYGILEKTIAYDAGARIETNNLAYDAETGEVLLTQTQNEFEDKIYSFAYPAHWGYGNMGPAYTNVGVTIKAVSFNGLGASATNIGSYFATGDELAMYPTSSGSPVKGWVCSTTPGSTISVIDKDGNPISGSYNITIIRSGRRNQQSTSIGSLTCMLNPIDINNDGTLETNINGTNAFGRVLKTNAIEFSDKWQMLEGYKGEKPGNSSCHLTEAGQNFANFFYFFCHYDQTTTDGVVLYDQSTGYKFGFDAYQANIVPSPTTNTTWEVNSISGGVLQAAMVSGSYSCNVTAQMPAGTNWSDITFISTPSSSSPILSTNCLDNGGIEFCAAHINSATHTTVTALPGICFTITPSGGNGVNCGSWTTASAGGNGGTDCGYAAGDRVNPYMVGIRGNWRPLRTYAYLASRQRNSSTGTDLRHDGYMVTKDNAGTVIPYQPFWKANSGNDWGTYPTYWTWAAEAKKFNTNGQEVETMDLLGRYSSAVYGYNDLLPVVVASNAKYTQVAYDGFEDYDYIPDCRKRHFNFYENKQYRSGEESHTGQYSLKVPLNGALTCTRQLTSAACNATSPGLCAYDLTCKDFIGQFSPETYAPVIPAGQKARYIICYWVKEKELMPGQPQGLDYQNSSIEVNVLGSALPLTQISKSSVIDGWQRFEYSFDIPSGATGNIDVSLISKGTKAISYFDDVRIFPYQSNIKTFVYNPVSLKYVAELDANNFATFYEYNEEGGLIRVKKETMNGIMTVKETKNYTLQK